MNKNAQLDFHPDAESLNAFAEQALVGREREEIVEHLAVCSRCRQVVFLAQEAAVVLEPAIAAVALPAPVRREPWYTNWRFAWVPLGAMAMVGTLAYIVHLQQVETHREMAQVVNQAPPQMEVRAFQPAAPSAQKQEAPKPAAPEAAEQKQRVLKAKAQTEEAEQLALATPAAAPAPAAPPPQVQAAPRRAEGNEPADSGNSKAAEARSAPGSSLQAMGALAEYRQEQADSGLKKEEERGRAANEVHGLALKNAEKANADEAVAKQAETDQLMPASAAAAASQQVVVSPAPAVGRGVGGGRGAFAVYKAKAIGLPSGLAAVSTAVAQHSLLVVDKAGSVFLSEDAGSHWESIPRQWNGRAVAVRTKAATEANAQGMAGSAEQTKAGFELVNDQGQVWTSADGRTWKTP